MKKYVSILLVVAMAMTVLAACGGQKEYKLGMGVVVSTSSSKEGQAQVDATYAAVVVDKDGKIVDCAIDVAQNKQSIAEGVAAVGQTYLTKQEKKEDYGMKGVSGIGKEWYEQADFFANFVVGKTAAEVAALETAESNGHQVSTDADLLAGCTMDIVAMKEAVAKACNDEFAKSFKAGKEVNVGIAAETEDSSSKDATEEAAGLSAMYTTFGATVVVDGKVAAALVDTIQPKINFDQAGAIGEVNFKGTKRELKENYGMAGVSGIGKEWFEQAAFFTDYVAGKSIADIQAIELVESNAHMVATDADILAGCTMDIEGYISVLAKSAK